MVVAQFVCAKYSMDSAEGRNEVCVPWTPLPAPSFPESFLFPSHPPVLAGGAHSGWGGQGELEK